MVGRTVQLVLAEGGDKLQDVIPVLGANLIFRSEACPTCTQQSMTWINQNECWPDETWSIHQEWQWLAKSINQQNFQIIGLGLANTPRPAGIPSGKRTRATLDGKYKWTVAKSSLDIQRFVLRELCNGTDVLLNVLCFWCVCSWNLTLN